MKDIHEHLEKIRSLKKKHYHPLIHKTHKKYKISKKTLFYVKEYGPHTNVPRTIIKESIQILLLASLISSFGGFTIERIKDLFITITPLVILLPALNGMIGNYGIVFSSRLATLLHEGKVERAWWKNKELRELLVQIFITSMVTATLCALISLLSTTLATDQESMSMAGKIFFISIVDTIFFVALLILVSIYAGFYIYKKQEDPNNFLIPITTSIADFGNMIILAGLVIIMF